MFSKFLTEKNNSLQFQAGITPTHRTQHPQDPPFHLEKILIWKL